MYVEDDFLDEAMPVRRRRKDPYGVDNIDIDDEEVVSFDIVMIFICL